MEEAAPQIRPTVSIVDDDDAGRESLRWLIESVGLKVEAFASPIEFLEQFDGSHPGCLVLDIRLPKISGLDVLKTIRDRGIETPAIMITAFGDVPMAVRAMKNGAVDFLQKPFNDQELLDRIQQSIEDDYRLREVDKDRNEIMSRLEKLTVRDREVLSRLVQGKQNKQIAREMDISPKTVEAHRAKVMEKMRADSLVKLVQMVTSLEVSQVESQAHP